MKHARIREKLGIPLKTKIIYTSEYGKNKGKSMSILNDDIINLSEKQSDSSSFDSDNNSKHSSETSEKHSDSKCDSNSDSEKTLLLIKIFATMA